MNVVWAILITLGVTAVAVAAMLMGGLLVFRHRANIQKLLQGTESRLGRKAAGAAAAHPHPHPHPHPSKHSHKHGAHKP